MRTVSTPEAVARAFNFGSNARLADAAQRDNPYPPGLLAEAWDAGWWDVDEYWPTPLPQGKGAAL